MTSGRCRCERRLRRGPPPRPCRRGGSSHPSFRRPTRCSEDPWAWVAVGSGIAALVGAQVVVAVEPEAAREAEQAGEEPREQQQEQEEREEEREEEEGRQEEPTESPA